jgi:VCBS repeat-containing protein
MGSFSLDSSGQWTYAMSGPQDKLVEGVSYTDTAEVTTADGTTQTLQVNITGTDDLSIVGGNSAVTITETNDAQIVTSALTVTDVDGLAAFVPQTDVLGSNGYGNFSVSASGQWVYTMNDAHNEFLPGEFYTDSVTVTTIDNVQRVVTVNIQGTDVASIFQGDILKQLNETDINGSVSGQLTTTDADSDVAASVVPQSSLGDKGYGAFTVDSTGAWTYTLNDAHNEFIDGQTYVDTITVSNTDGTSQLLSVHIEGTNDAAVISGSSSANIVESDSVQSVSGQLRSVDVDSPSTFNAQDAVAGNHGYGQFSIDTSGFWTYTLDNAQDQLVGGQSYTDSATVTSIDGTQQVITVHVNGTNDSAVITPTVVQLSETDDILYATGQIELSDIDNDTQMHPGIVPGTYGLLTMQEDGTWTYVTRTANNQFVADQTYSETFTVKSLDGTKGTIQVNILGTNDGAAISGATTLGLTETNLPQTATALVVSTDDDNLSTFVANSELDGDHGYGTFSIDAAGQWTYTMNAAHDAFVAGKVYTDSVTVSTIDGTSFELKVNITGDNDAAEITAEEILKFETDAALTASGQLEVTDVDSNAAFNEGTFTGTYGSLTLTASGAWNYTASSAHNEFIPNGLYSDVFNVTSVDGTVSSIKIHMIGTAEANDDLYTGAATVNIPDSFTDDSFVHLSTAGVQQVQGGDDNLGALVNGREDTVKLDFNLADATMKTSADGHHVEVSFQNDASTVKTLSDVEAVQFNDALVRIIGAGGYKDVAEATDTSNVSHVKVGVDAVFVSVASGYDALVQHGSEVDLSNTYTALTDAYNHH